MHEYKIIPYMFGFSLVPAFVDKDLKIPKFIDKSLIQVQGFDCGSARVRKRALDGLLMPIS